MPQVPFSPSVESFTVEDCDDYLFLKDSIKILSSSALSKDESLNVPEEGGNNDSLYVCKEKGPILESLCFKNNTTVHIFDNVDFKIGSA